MPATSYIVDIQHSATSEPEKNPIASPSSTDLVADAVDERLAALRRKKELSVSGCIEADLREFSATGDHEIGALERYLNTARRSATEVR